MMPVSFLQSIITMDESSVSLHQRAVTVKTVDEEGISWAPQSADPFLKEDTDGHGVF